MCLRISYQWSITIANKHSSSTNAQSWVNRTASESTVQFRLSHIMLCVTLFSSRTPFVAAFFPFPSEGGREGEGETIRNKVFVSNHLQRRARLSAADARFQQSIEINFHFAFPLFFAFFTRFTCKFFSFRFFFENFFFSGRNLLPFVTARVLTIWAQLHRQWCFISLGERKREKCN